MKKKNSIHLLFAAAALLLATAACTKDEPADSDLPSEEEQEGQEEQEEQYPLEIARITFRMMERGEALSWGAPQMRVSENADGNNCMFETGDQFAVQIDGDTQTGIYTVQADGSAKAGTPLFWSDRDNHTVHAWYPATDGTLDLGDQQTDGLAYLLNGTGTGDYLTPVTLNFTHALAKVRITPTDEALGEVQSIQLYTCTRCTYEKGQAVQGSQEGWIEMKRCAYNGATCWEANVVPGYEITKLRTNGSEERDLSAAITPVAGKFYEITLNYDPGYVEVSEGNYTTGNKKGLINLARLANDGATDINITLTGDIDLSGIDWVPIGTDFDIAYTGTFDGGGHTITGLTVTGSYHYAGLFGCIGEGGSVKDLTLKDVQIESDYVYGNVGSVAGFSYYKDIIANCSVSGSVSGSSAGGLVGSQWGGFITGCNSSVTVKGESTVGGVAGTTNADSTMTACYATGDVILEGKTTDTHFVGGVVGFNGVSTLVACYATGNVSGSGSGNIYVGGVTGVHDSRTMTACYHAKGIVSGPGGTTGGVAGETTNAFDNPVITACYWGDNGQDQSVGENQAGITVEATKVADGNWEEAKNAMNTALGGTGWQYELTGALPTLKKQ